MSKRKETNIDLTVPPFPPSFPWPCVLVLTVRHGLLSIRGGGAWGNKCLGKAAILRQFIPGCLRSDPPEMSTLGSSKLGSYPAGDCGWFALLEGIDSGQYLLQRGRDLKRDYNGSDWREVRCERGAFQAETPGGRSKRCLYTSLAASLSGTIWTHLLSPFGGHQLAL